MFTSSMKLFPNKLNCAIQVGCSIPTCYRFLSFFFILLIAYLQKISANSQGDCNDLVEFESTEANSNSSISLSCSESLPPFFISDSHSLKVSLKLGLETTSRGFIANITYYGRIICSLNITCYICKQPKSFI